MHELLYLIFQGLQYLIIPQRTGDRAKPHKNWRVKYEKYFLLDFFYS